MRVTVMTASSLAAKESPFWKRSDQYAYAIATGRCAGVEYLYDGEQAADPRLGGSEHLPAADIHDGLDESDVGEPSLAGAAIQERADAGLELVDEPRGALRRCVVLGLLLVRRRQRILAADDVPREGGQRVRQLRGRDRCELAAEHAQIRGRR